MLRLSGLDLSLQSSYYESKQRAPITTLHLNLHTSHRRLIDLKIEHADLDALIDTAAHAAPIDELMLRRLKKRRLMLRDQISRIELSLDPPESA